MPTFDIFFKANADIRHLLDSLVSALAVLTFDIFSLLSDSLLSALAVYATAFTSKLSLITCQLTTHRK